MADRTGNRVSAGSGDPLSVVRFGRDEMNQHERLVDVDAYPGDPVTLGANADDYAAWVGYTAGDSVYVVKDARGRGVDINTTDGYQVDPDGGDGPEAAPGLKASGGGLNLRVTAPSGGGDVTIEPGTAITPTAADGFVAGDANGVFAVAEDDVTIADGETEIVATEVA